MNIKNIIEKLEIKKKYIYIDVKTDKDEYVKLIIYIYIYIIKKIKKIINNNYVANNMAIRWCNKNFVVINITLQFSIIYRLSIRASALYSAILSIDYIAR